MAKFRANNPNNGGGDDRRLPVKPPGMEIVEPRCNVCKSKWRRTIDQLLVVGVPYKEIARQFEGEQLSRKSISNHRQKHLTIEDAVVRQVLEEKAKQMGEDIENGAKTILTRLGILDVAIMKGYSSVVTGAVPVEAADLVKLVALREKLEESSSSIQIQELEMNMQSFLDAVHNVVPKAFWKPIADEFEAILAKRGKMVDAYAITLPDIDIDDELRRALEAGD